MGVTSQNEDDVGQVQKVMCSDCHHDGQTLDDSPCSPVLYH